MDSPNARLAPGRDKARPQNGPPGGRALPQLSPHLSLVTAQRRGEYARQLAFPQINIAPQPVCAKGRPQGFSPAVAGTRWSTRYSARVPTRIFAPQMPIPELT